MPLVTELLDEFVPPDAIVGVYTGETNLIPEGRYEDSEFQRHAHGELQVLDDSSEAEALVREAELQGWAAILEDDDEVRWHPVRYVAGD